MEEYMIGPYSIIQRGDNFFVYDNRPCWFENKPAEIINDLFGQHNIPANFQEFLILKIMVDEKAEKEGYFKD